MMSYKVDIDGVSSFTADEGDTLLSAALRSRIGFPYDCSSGGCGNCRFELVSGEVSELWPEAPGLSARDRSKRKHLACQCLAKSDLKIKVRTGDEYLPAIPPGRITGQVSAIRDVTHDMREITIKTQSPACFKPGQYAFVSSAGVARPRAYSMSNLPNDEGIWQFIIRKVPGGAFTAHLFDAVKPGDPLILDGPYGMAWLREDSQRDILCISGGSGLAPMLSIARGASGKKMDRRINFYFGARTAVDIPGPRDLDFLMGSQSPCTSKIVVSNPDDSWAGETGFVHECVERDFGSRLEDLEIYLAGPPAMVDAVQEMLFIRYRVPVQQVHLDRFF